MQEPPPTDDPPEFGPDAEHSWEDVIDLPPFEEREAASLEWSTSIGDSVPGSPTIVDGTVFVPSLGTGLHALDAGDGTTRWTHDLLLGTASAPAVHDGVAYLVTVFSSVVAIELASNEVRWESDTNSEYPRRYGFTPSPLVANGRVIAGTASGILYAYDAPTGEVDWETGLDGPVIASSIFHDGAVIVPGMDGTLHSVDVLDGSNNWSVTLEGIGYASPTVADGTVFVGAETGTVYARDAGTGEEVWTHERDGEIVATQTVADGTVFVGDSDDRSSGLLALDAANGERIWSTDRSRVVSSPTVAGDRVYASYVNVAGYDVDTGERSLLVTETESGFRSSPTVVDGILYVGSRDGSVYAVATGTSASSRGSRVQDGTFGHVGPASANDGSSSDEASSSAASATSGNESGGGDDALSGPGIAGAVGSILGTKVLLDRTRSAGDTDGRDGAQSGDSDGD